MLPYTTDYPTICAMQSPLSSRADGRPAAICSLFADDDPVL